MAVVFALLAAIARNVVINLEAVGKEFSFDFFKPAAYDIGFSPFLDYTNQSTHLRAAVVGLLNTLLIAFWGCILATMVGFVLGIMRLSSNWLVSKLVCVCGIHAQRADTDSYPGHLRDGGHCCRRRRKH